MSVVSSDLCGWNLSRTDMPEKSSQKLLARIADLEAKLEEAESTLMAIRQGEVDALLVSGNDGDRIFTLEGADHPYRILVQEMHEGTVTLDPHGLILYANAQFGSMLKLPLPTIAASKFQSLVADEDRDIFSALLSEGAPQRARSELTLIAEDGTRVPTYVSLNSLQGGTTCLVIADLTEQHRNQAILESEQLSRSILEQATEIVLVVDVDGKIVRASDAANKLVGHNILFQCFDAVIPLHSGMENEQTRIDANYLLSIAASGMAVRSLEVLFSGPNREKLCFLLSGGPLWSATRELLGCVITLTDITERRRSEEQLNQMQRLESLGVLAGGVAHDFNNLLTGILGNCSLVLEDLPQSSPNRHLMEEAVRASERAAELTQQLLAYAGKGVFSRRIVKLSDQVREIVNLVRTSISKKVFLDLRLDDDLPVIKADPGQLNQVVMNLVLNGAEAIGEKAGVVRVRTGLERIDSEQLDGFEGVALQPGAYVFLEVEDTGCGMDEATRKKIFEPFFTTKFQGRGLGLSAVIGIIGRHKGALRVKSQPGEGTTFKILFPLTEGASEKTAIAEWPLRRGTGTILVVDDEPTVRATARTALTRSGFDVLLAEDGRVALDLYRKRADEISLVLLDLTMPEMSGEETFAQLRTIKPDVKVVLSSGYSEREAARSFRDSDLAGFLQKPYTGTELSEKVGAALKRP